MTKILLTTIGTLGDLNPIIALAKVLKENGFTVGVATCIRYKENVQSAGLTFHLVRPDYDPKDPVLCKAIMDPLRTLLNVHKMILTKEQIELSVQDFEELLKEYDAIIGNVFSYPAKIACLKSNKKWVSLNLSPLCFFSKYSPPDLYPLTILNRIGILGPSFFNFLFRTMFKLVDHWGKEVHLYYKRHKLGECGNLLLDAPFSKYLNISLFSKVLGQPQKDWPINTVTTGFLFYSGETEQEICSELQSFLDNGEAPILFTFGSTAVHNIDFYINTVLKISKSVNQRCIITVGKEYLEKYSHLNSDSLYICDFLPYTTTLHMMKLIVHQGGIGTVSSCLKAGVPQIVMPYCTDQFDNAKLIKENGLGEVVPTKKLTYNKLYKSITKIINSDSYIQNANRVKAIIREEKTEDNIIEMIKKYI